MKPIGSVYILFRAGHDEDTKAEMKTANMFFPVHTIREAIPSDSLVIPRYSLLPYPEEVTKGLNYYDSKTINSLEEHQFIAKFWGWYDALKEAAVPTPKSWCEYDFSRVDHPGPFVVKGATNSKKWSWRTHMYAENHRDAVVVGSRLRQDSMIGDQDLIYREYVPLKADEIGINDVPFAHEWRFFFLGPELLASSYYWSPAEDQVPVPEEAEALALRAAQALSQHTTFFVVDVAVTEAGEYLVIEINDGQMSGLSEIEPMTLYSRLHKAMQARYPERF